MQYDFKAKTHQADFKELAVTKADGVYNGSWTFLRDQKNHASTDAFSDFNILFLPRKRQDSQRHKHQKDTVKKLKINKITVKIVMVCEFSMT